MPSIVGAVSGAKRVDVHDLLSEMARSLLTLPGVGEMGNPRPYRPGVTRAPDGDGLVCDGRPLLITSQVALPTTRDRPRVLVGSSINMGSAPGSRPT